jgi:hypothetical protein
MSKRIAIKAAATMIGRHHLTIRRWIKAGKMPIPHRIGPALFFYLDDIERFIAEQRERGLL